MNTPTIDTIRGYDAWLTHQPEPADPICCVCEVQFDMDDNANPDDDPDKPICPGCEDEIVRCAGDECQQWSIRPDNDGWEQRGSTKCVWDYAGRVPGGPLNQKDVDLKKWFCEDCCGAYATCAGCSEAIAVDDDDTIEVQDDGGGTDYYCSDCHEALRDEQ